MTLTKEVVAVQWEESERGWGVRPDGCSLHVSVEEAKEYQKKHFVRLHDIYGDESPDEYK